MKITLKNVKINLAFSEETTQFMSDLYIDGKNVGYCKNDGRGGSTYYHWNDVEGRGIIQKCEEFYKSLPKKTFTFQDGIEIDFCQTIEGEIDEIVDNIVNEKEKKRFEIKMKKDMVKGLVLSKGNPNQYETMSWKNSTIMQLVETSKGEETLKKTIQDMKDKGYIILNTNIPISWL